MNLSIKQNEQDFRKFLSEKIDLGLFQYKFLKNYFKDVQQGIKPIFDMSVANTTTDGWLVILHGETLMIYGDGWSKEQFVEIQEVFNLNKYTNYTVTGNSELITELIKFFKIENYKIQKERIFYKASKINDFLNDDLKIELGKLTELTELAAMLQEYYHEEYNGFNDKSIEEMQQRVFYLIQSQEIHVLKNADDNILGFCTIINPDVGILFTKAKYREKGYGKTILSHCSNLLLESNDTVYLMTDKEKPASNVVCKKVGFEPYYNYIMTKINIG